MLNKRDIRGKKITHTQGNELVNSILSYEKIKYVSVVNGKL